MREKIKKILENNSAHISDGMGDHCSGYDEEGMEVLVDELLSLIETEKS